MEIVRCDNAYRDAWDQYVSSHCQGSFYHRFAWRDINSACFGHESSYLAAVQGTTIVGVLPIVRIRSRLFGTMACSLPFVNYGGVCADDVTAEAALLREAEKVADEWRVEYLEIRSRQRLGEALPHSDHKVSMAIELDPDPEKLWGAFKTGHRQEIRRAAKNGFEVRIGTTDLLNDFYDVLSESWRDLGTPLYPKRYFAAILRAFPENVRLAVAYVGGGLRR